MHQTLFVIPHWWLQGWALGIWLVFGALIIATMYLRKMPNKDILSFVPVYLIVAAAIHFIVPHLEVKGLDPDNPDGPLIPLGLAIRGYGFCMLLGMVAGISVAAYRCREANIPVERLISLSFWLIITGIIGARLFYIIQYWEDFRGSENLFAALIDMTKGGLVVYGSLIGGMIGGVGFIVYTKIPLWKTADVVAPGMMIGLAFGRIGCLMNGCCWGGACDIDQIAVRFPAGAPPYIRQFDNGQIIGLETKQIKNSEGEKTDTYEIKAIEENSIAAQYPLSVGQKIKINYSERRSPDLERTGKRVDMVLRGMHEQNLEFQDPGLLLLIDADSQQSLAMIPLEDLPARARPIHPTQVYSSINAFIIFSILMLYHSFRRGDGETFALLLILYSPTRFLLEQIRSDEYGKFGTDFTISQWVSLGAIAVGIALFLWRRNAGISTYVRPHNESEKSS